MCTITMNVENSTQMLIATFISSKKKYNKNSEVQSPNPSTGSATASELN